MDQATSDRILGRDRGWRVDWRAANAECEPAMLRKARWVLSASGLPTELERDAVQDAWLALYTTDPSTIRNIEALAVTLTWRRAVDLCRRGQSVAKRNVAEEPCPGPEDMYFNVYDEMRLRDAVSGLVEQVLVIERERRIFVECQLKDRTRTSVADEEGISPQRVGQILGSAIRKLTLAARARLDTNRSGS